MLTNEQVLSIAKNILYLDDFKLATLQDTKGIDWLDKFITELNYDDYKTVALMIHTGDTYDNLYTDIYKVYNEYERDKALEEYAEYYYNDIILPEIPQHLHYYFDEDEWKADYINSVDAGEVLSSDCIESEVTVLDETFYIYQI